ncbi:hypothetical protein ACFL35_09960 [Candidatus Riflebacteria bacterium]
MVSSDEKKSKSKSESDFFLLPGSRALAFSEIRASEACSSYFAQEGVAFGQTWLERMAKGHLNIYGNPLIFVPPACEKDSLEVGQGLGIFGLRCGHFLTSIDLEHIESDLRKFSKRGLPFVLNMVHPFPGRLLTYYPLQDQFTKEYGAYFFFYCRNAQQAADLTLIGHRVAEKLLCPGVIALDMQIAHNSDFVKFPPRDSLAEFLGVPSDMVKSLTVAQKERFGEQRRRIPRLLSGKTFKIYKEYFDEEIWKNGAALFHELVNECFKEYENLTGRAYNTFETYRTDDADYLLIGYGSVMNELVPFIDIIQEKKGIKIGTINLIVRSPFPFKALSEKLKNVKAIGILQSIAGIIKGTSAMVKKIDSAIELAGFTKKSRPKIYHTWYRNPGEVDLEMVVSLIKKMVDRIAISDNQKIEELGTSKDFFDIGKVSLAQKKVAMGIQAPGKWSPWMLGWIGKGLRTIAKNKLQVNFLKNGNLGEDVASAIFCSDFPFRPGVENLDFFLSAEQYFLKNLTADYLENFNQGASIIIRGNEIPLEEQWTHLSEEIRKVIKKKKLKLFIIDTSGCVDIDVHRQEKHFFSRLCACFEGALFAKTDLLSRLNMGFEKGFSPLRSDELNVWRKKGTEAFKEIPQKVLKLEEAKEKISPISIKKLPKLPNVEPAEETEKKAFLQEARNFFMTGKGGGIGNLLSGPTVIPARLAPYRERSFPGYDFPLWVPDPGPKLPSPLFLPLSNLFTSTIFGFAPGADEASLLKENLPLIENIIRKNLAPHSYPRSFSKTIKLAISELEEILSLSGKKAEEFSKCVQQFIKALPDSGSLIPFSPQLPLYLFASTLKTFKSEKRHKINKELTRITNGLHDLLTIEESKSSEGRRPEKLGSSIGLGSNFIDTREFSQVLPKVTTRSMPVEQKKRIERLIQTLEDFKTGLKIRDSIVLLPESWYLNPEYEWEKVFPSSFIISVTTGDICSRAVGVFEGHMAFMAEILRSIRLAQLEIDNAYVPEIHEDFFTYFDWKSFTEEEMALCPPVVFIDDETSIQSNPNSSLSRLLLSGKPIKAVIFKKGFMSGSRMTTPDHALFGFTQELGYQAIAHEKAFVLQSSAGNPEHLIPGYLEGIKSLRPSLFYLLPPKPEETRFSDPYIWVQSALESRKFPYFSFNPSKEKQEERIKLDGNPQPDRDWPIYKVKILDKEGREKTIELPFTYADFAALDSLFYNQFFPVPHAFEMDEFIPLIDYFKLPSHQIYDKIPFIWMVDENWFLQRVLVSYPLVLSSKERLDYWNHLQERGGRLNRFVLDAASKARKEVEEKFKKEMQAVKANHTTELEKAKRETARVAMENLAAILLDMDMDSLAVSSGAPIFEKEVAKEAAAKAVKTAPEPAALPEKAKESKAPVESVEPWIDSENCTSCSECIRVNSKMFKYNKNKQAYIKDPKVGTFEQLVIAAEKCAAKVIHPGTPLNLDEPGLKALLERARPFSDDPDQGGAEEEVVSEEPWIDSENCTSCAECIKVNSKMFKYNKNKQAYIKDPKAGTFEQMVIAAEKCASKVIHPGTPLNPDEANLEALLKRAEAFK